MDSVDCDGGAFHRTPYQTVYDVLHGWQRSSATERMHAELRAQCRIAAGRTPGPSAAVIDSQSVRAAETVGKASRGYDAGKDRRPQAAHRRDTIGLLLTVLITAASVQDSDGAKPLLWNLCRAFPSSGWPGPTAATPTSSSPGRKQSSGPRLALQIVKRTERHKFIVLPRRWVVERTFSWITRSRRTVQYYERLPGHHETMVYWAMTIIMTRRLARHNQSHQLHPT